MHNKKVVIIGSGLGGLASGVILAKNGYDVTIFEKSNQVGGCLQCFKRRGVKFETGMHFIGSASKGQTLHRLMKYLEIDDKVMLSQLDPNAYDIVSIGGKEYKFANGRSAFIKQMSEYFPSQRKNLENYFDLIENVSKASSLHSLKEADKDVNINTEYQLRSINEVIDSIIDDPELSKVLVGNLPLYAAEYDKTPFSVHAFIMDFYNQSAYRVVGGSDSIASALVSTLQKYGGKISTNSAVTKILCDDSCATSVEVNHHDIYTADYIISDTHPNRTLDMLDTKLIRPAFRERIKAIPQTVGGFSVYMHFKENVVPYINYNYYSYSGTTPGGCENYDDFTWPKGYLYMHFCHEYEPHYAKTGVILSYMQMEEVKQWLGTTVGKRGKEYEDFKRIKAEKLISSLEKKFPNIRNCIQDYYTSTPLTYLDYTGTESGSMYGIAKDISKGAAYRVPHKTRIPNVLLTGQNINSHGMLGVLVGTIVTCSELLSSQRIYEQILKANL